MSLKVLHSLLDSQLWKRLNLKAHFLDKEMMRIFSAHFARGDSGGTTEGQANECTKANAELNTPADFDAIHENTDVGDRGQSVHIHMEMLLLLLIYPVSERHIM